MPKSDELPYNALERDNNYEQAGAYNELLLQASPDDAGGLHAKATLLVKWKKDYAGALSILNKLLASQGPGNGATYYKIAGVYSLLNKPDDSLEFLTLAMSAGKSLGSKDNAQLDEEFASLRKDPRFWALVNPGQAAGRAENWVDDVDSIHKGDDGVVYFNHQNKDPDSLPMERSFAFDCEKGLIYDSLFGPDWKSKGIPVTEETPGEAWKTFVCSRAP